jgi:diguanylate cyclase (GGDEF)-like protein
MGPWMQARKSANPVDSSAPLEQRHGRRLLIVKRVGNDPTILVGQIRRGEFEVAEASGNDEALARIEAQELDVVVLDASAPGHDGMDRRDPLTGLLNRFGFDEKLEESRKKSAEDGSKICVLCLDLDGFKMVNETLGHAIGDELLGEIAKRLRRAAGPQDFVARLGSDEFGLIHASNEVHAAATSLAQRVIDAVDECRRIGEHEIFVSASVGVAVSDEGARSSTSLLMRADLALDRAKSSGGGAFRFFEPEMERVAHRRRELEIDLRKAASCYDFDLHYQPIVNLASQRVTGLEALMRWDHPERGFVPPYEFVALAEDTGLIGSMGEWALRKACLDAARWPSDMRVAVNLSPRQVLSPGLIFVVVNALAASGLAPSRLELEITESAFLERTDQTLTMLRQFRELGVRVSLDDFGAGYAGLGYLRDFKFDNLKVDQSFVREMPRLDSSAAIVRAALNLGASLGMTTIGEGVENDAELSCLVAGGCIEAQGYLFGAPQPRSQVFDVVERLERQAEKWLKRSG